MARVQELLEEGAPINDVDTNGWSALYTATVYGNEGAVKALLSWTSPRADVDKPNNNGVTALMAAARDGYTNVMVHLLNGGADVKQVDEFGRTVSGRSCHQHDRKLDESCEQFSAVYFAAAMVAKECCASWCGPRPILLLTRKGCNARVTIAND